MVAIVDGHVHARDWGQDYKDTIARVSYHAGRNGVGLVMLMPNTNPALTSMKLVKDYLELARETRVGGVSVGLHVGLTSDPAQIREAVECTKRYSLREDGRVGVVGLKMFAGRSTGDLAIIDRDEQKRVYDTLAKYKYEGVLVVHCEKESSMKPWLWSPEVPWSHSFARPAEAEMDSLVDQVDDIYNSDFYGILHIAHVSTPAAVDYICDVRDNDVRNIKITCGSTSHHLFVNYRMMKDLSLKVNPPLRSEVEQVGLLDRLKLGKINQIESDHANHMLAEKFGRTFDNGGNPIYMSGIPVVHTWREVVRRLEEEGFSQSQIDMLTGKNTLETYGLPESVVGNAEVVEDLSVKGYEYGYGDLV